LKYFVAHNEARINAGSSAEVKINDSVTYGDAETTDDDGMPQLSCDANTTSSATDTCHLTTSGTFGDYVMLTTSGSVVVMDARQLTTQCYWSNVTLHAGASVWIEPLRL